jgi:hypothetical protein
MFDFDLVKDSANTGEVANGSFGVFAFVPVVDVPFERDPAARHRAPNPFVGNEDVPFESMPHCIGDLGAYAPSGDFHRNVVGNVEHAGDSVRRLLSRDLLGPATHRTGKVYDAGVDLDADIRLFQTA